MAAIFITTMDVTMRLNLKPFIALFLLLNTLFNGAYAAPIPVEVTPIEKRFVSESIDVVGDIRAHDEVKLAAEVAGTVAKIVFVEGESVKAGEVVALLDDALFAAEVRRAQASFQLAELRLQRDQQLYQKRTISQSVLEESQAELEERRAALDVAEVRLSKTRLIAPFDGWSGLRHFSVGDYVSPGEPLVTLVNDQPLLIDFSVPHRAASLIEVGDKVEFTVGQQHLRREARVIAIEPSMDRGSRALKVRAQYDNAERDVISGNFAKVMFSVASVEPLLVVPAQSLIGVSGGYVVYLLEEGKAARYSVRIIRREGNMAILENTLPEGAQLIMAGFQRVRPGADVIPVVVGE